MNQRQLLKLGIPPAAVPAAWAAMRQAGAAESAGRLRGKDVKQRLRGVVAASAQYLDDPIWGALARQLAAPPPGDAPRAPLAYRTWGAEIDPAVHAQMEQACRVPAAVGAALMPDAHVGYGLPIGGVLACDNAVIPYAVGVDIACRMKLSVLDVPPAALDQRREAFREALRQGTRFGVGSAYERPQHHPVMDRDWSVTRVTREKKDVAWRQLGTSGSGNHFVEFGLLTLGTDDAELGLAAGQHVALLSHSGSRGAGAAVCSVYSQIAQQRLPAAFRELGRLAWLELSSEAGQEYWAAMELMGEYAAANHAVIHHRVVRLLGAHVTAGVENHHNFAWLEEHGGRRVVVHRKGATPAGQGTLGIIPGSMADPAFVVRGRGAAASFRSASHGAGRRMSRTQAKQSFRLTTVRKALAERGIEVLAAGSDEVPGAYKDIRQVMAAQQDLVDTVAQFDPRLVMMCGDGSQAED